MATSRQRLGILASLGLMAAVTIPRHVHATGVAAAYRLVAYGLDHPKGITVTPNGTLYVAESGHSSGSCPPPTQTATVTSAGNTGSVAMVSVGGTFSRPVRGLFSSCDLGDFIGPSAVAVLNSTLYVLQASCLGQFPPPARSCTVSQPLLRVNADGTTSAVAQFVSHGNSDTPNQPDENPYGMVVGSRNTLYVSDGANNSIWRVTPGPTLQTISQPLVQFPHDPTLTGITIDRAGTLYGALFGKAPFLPGVGKIARVSPDGRYQYILTGLNSPIGVAVSRAGTLYVLQYASAFLLKPFPHFLPNSGAVLRVTPQGGLVPVVTGLNAPTSMVFGPDGGLYITNNGTSPVAVNTGQVVKAFVGA